MNYKFIMNRNLVAKQMRDYYTKGLPVLSKVKFPAVQARSLQGDGGLNPSNPASQNKPNPVVPSSNVETRPVHTSGPTGQMTLPGAPTKYGPANPEIRKMQQHYQKRDGLPVYLKGGPNDKILFQVTLGAAVLGAAGAVAMFLQMALM